MATVLAIGYPEGGTAARVAEEIRRRRGELRIEPDAVAVIARTDDGEYRVITSHHPVAEQASWGMFWGLLFGLVFFVPVFGTAVGPSLGSLFGEIEQAGINRAFQQSARDIVEPGTSALFLLTRSVDPDVVASALEGFGGTVLRASLSDGQEAKLLEAIHGRLSATV
jgi:uncharacterized membrane protein